MARRIYRRFVYGLNRIGKMQVFTSSGAGTWGPPLRTDEVAFRAEGDGEVLQAVLRQMGLVLNDNADVVGVDFVRRRLATVVAQAKETLSTGDLDDAPARDVRVYRDEDDGKPSRGGRARV